MQKRNIKDNENKFQREKKPHHLQEADSKVWRPRLGSSRTITKAVFWVIRILEPESVIMGCPVTIGETLVSLKIL